MNLMESSILAQDER